MTREMSFCAGPKTHFADYSMRYNSIENSVHYVNMVHRT